MVMRIKELRKAADMRQVEFGSLVGASQSTVSDWETETYLPKTRELPRIATVLGCSIDDLFCPLEDACR